MVNSILKVLGAGLSIWEHKEKNKYAEKLMQLRKDWYEEYNKPDDVRSDAALDRIELELLVLCDSFAAKVGIKDASTK